MIGPLLEIAEGLDVAPALSELRARPHYWLRVNSDDSPVIPLLGAGDGRLLEAELPEVWRLIDAVLSILAAGHGDAGGIDGIASRRYQLALRSEAGVALTVDGETICPRPGEAWQIDASRVHSIFNGSAADRITILFDTSAGG